MFFHVKEILPIISRFQSELWVAIKKYNSLDLWICFLIHEPFFEVQPTDVGPSGLPLVHQAQVDLQTVRSNMQALHESGNEFFLFFFLGSWKLGSFRVSSFGGPWVV